MAGDDKKLVGTALAEATTQLIVADSHLTYALPILRKGTLADTLATWYLMREQYDELDKKRKAIGEKLEQMSRETLPEMMAENNCKTFSHEALGRRFTVAQRSSCSMLDKEEAIKWLRSNGYGDIVQETVNSGTLAAFASRRLEEDGLDLPNEIFKMSAMRYMSATKT